MVNPSEAVALLENTFELGSAAVEKFKEIHDSIRGPIRTAMDQAEAKVRSRFKNAPTVQIDQAMENLNDTGAPWVLAFSVWKGHDVDKETTAEKWSEIAGTTLGIGDDEISEKVVQVYTEEFTRAAASGKEGEGFHEIQSQRRHEEILSRFDAQEERGEAMYEALSMLVESVKQDNEDPEYHEIAQGFRERLDAAVRNLNRLHLQSVIDETQSILDDLDRMREMDPKSESTFLGLRQITLAIKGQALALRGDIPGQEEVAGVLRNGGPIVSEALRPVALFAADVGDEEWLQELLPDLPDEMPERPFLEVAAEAMDDGGLLPEEVLERTSQEETDVNLLSIRIDALIEALTPERAVEAAELIAQLDDTPDREALLRPRKQLLVGKKMFRLLKGVVQKRLETPGLDRGYLLDQSRERLKQASEGLSELGDEYLQGYLESLVTQVNFLRFVEEHKASQMLHERIRESQPEDGPIGAIERRDVTTPAQIERLEEQDAVDQASKRVMQAHQDLEEGNERAANRKFGAALEAADSVGRREMALGDYVHVLLEEPNPDVEKVERLLEEELARDAESLQVRLDWLGTLHVKLVDSRDGARAALEESSAQIEAYPQSLLLRRQRHSLLLRELRKEKERNKMGGKTGRRRIQLLEGIERNAERMYQILPAPSYLVYRGRSWAERNYPNRAWRSLKEAVERGIQDERIRQEVEEARP